MPKRFSALPLLLIVLGLAVLGTVAYFFEHSADAVRGIPQPPVVTAPVADASTPESCTTAGGIWNACASACPNATVGAPCIQMCVARCEGLDGKGRVDAYFPNPSLDQNPVACSGDDPVKREVERLDGGYPEAALHELLKGPSKEERTAGFTTSVPADVRLNALVVKGGTAHADFSAELSKSAGSCQVRSIRAQIENTLKQFPGIMTVVITIDGGSPDEALQP